MDTELTLILLWSAFAGTHLLLTSLRQRIIAARGLLTYNLVFTAVAFACFIPLVSIYLDNRHQGAVLWALPGWSIHVGMLLSVIGIAGVVASLFQPSPTGAVPTGHRMGYGLTRITRHPMFMSLGIWGLGHCMINSFATDVIFFAGFPLFAIIGCAHQDARKRNDPQHALEQFFAETSLLPFAAILTGRTRLVASELPWLALILGTGAAIGIYALHPWMFH